MSVAAEIPEGTVLEIAVRSAETIEKVKNKEWKTVSYKTFSLNKEDRYIQYKATFISENGDRFPVLDSIKIKIGK